MTVSNPQVRVRYVGDSISKTFAVPFPFFLATDLLVYLGGAQITTGYSVTGGGGHLGSLIMANAPATGVSLQIILNDPLTQVKDFVDGTAFPSDTINEVNDRAVQIDLRTRDLLSRCIGAPDGDVSPAMMLPPAAIRANLWLTFDASGNVSPAASLPPNQTLSQSTIGQFLYPITAAETAAGVTPVAFAYAPGVINRYGANLIPGTTIMDGAFAAALAQQQQGGEAVQLRAETYLVTTNAIKTQSNQIPVVVRGVPFRSCIVNTAGANTPTIQLIDQFTFEISGIVFAGRAGFPNTAIDLNSASGGQRCGFGQIRDCVLMPNGIGIHLAGLNDLVIDSCKYWPNGAGGYPGAATNDGANALPGGIVSDTHGIGGWNPGEVNAVYIRDFEAGQCNGVSATPPGAGILVDGSLNGSSTALNANHASTSWVIEGYDSGTCERALYTRFCQFFSLRNFYTSVITMDNACTGMLVEAMFGGQIVVDSTKTLGGCDRLTYINCVGTILADSGNSLATHINCDWFGGDGDQSGGKRILGGRVAAGARTADQIGASGLCVGPLGAIQLAGSSGAGLTVSSLGAAVIRLNPNGNCTATIFSKPPADGYVSKVINISAFTVTMDVAGTSNVADGTSCVIPAKREMDFTFDVTSQLWYHT